MHNSKQSRWGIGFVVLTVLLSLLFSAPAKTQNQQEQTGQVTVNYPEKLEDEHERPFKQAVKMEFYRVLSEHTKQQIMEGLEKQERQTDSAARKESLEREIARIAKLKTQMIYSIVMDPVGGGRQKQFSIPAGEYEVHFIPINPANRKPVVMPVTFGTGNNELTVAVAPQGGIIGGGPTLAELRSEIADLQERIKKLEDKK